MHFEPKSVFEEVPHRDHPKTHLRAREAAT
jgi:hypothetical protein